jgi:hypothetical protein
LLHAERDFEAFFMKARTGAGIGGASYSRGFIEPGSDFSQICFDRCLG